MGANVYQVKGVVIRMVEAMVKNAMIPQGNRLIKVNILIDEGKIAGITKAVLEPLQDY